MHDVKDSRTPVLQLPLTDMVVTKTTRWISAVNSLTETRGDLSFNAGFSVASGISISEQRRDRTGDEIMRFPSFLSHGCNTTTTSEVQLELTSLPSLPYCHGTAPCPSSKPDMMGEGLHVEREVLGMCSITNIFSSQCTFIHKSPSSLYTEFRPV